MKKFFIGCSAIVLSIALSSPLHAQLKLPAPSPGSTVTQVVGLTDVSIDYSRPGVKGRKIWGELVPYNELWRTGANASTKISFSDDVMIEGQKLPAGKYALYTLPGENEWTIIFNKNLELWGTDGYKQEEDALRIKVKPVAVPQQVESFTIAVSNVKPDGASVDLVWDKLQVSFSVKVDTDAKVLAGMKEATGDAVTVFARSANYCLQNNTNMDLAKQWIDNSIAIKPTFYNQWVKAQILAKEENYKDALMWAEKATVVGKAEGGSYKYYSGNVEKAMAGWKEKAKTGKKK